MRSSSLLLVVALCGSVVPLIAACSGRALELPDASAGSAGTGESSGAAGASAGTSPGGATSAGTSPGGAAGVAGALAGAGGETPREPAIHRPEPVACDHTRPSHDPNAPEGDDMSWVRCHSHADCTEGTNGRCGGNGHDGWDCTYDSCFEDSECGMAASGEPQLCQCEGGFRSDNNLCIGGNCRLDADCGAAGYCSPSLGSCGNYQKAVGYFCHTPSDECTDDVDCPAGQFGPGYCAFMPEIGHWKCSTAHCVG